MLRTPSSQQHTQQRTTTSDLGIRQAGRYGVRLPAVAKHYPVRSRVSKSGACWSGHPGRVPGPRGVTVSESESFPGGPWNLTASGSHPRR
jgi:hypothetical protein